MYTTFSVQYFVHELKTQANLLEVSKILHSLNGTVKNWPQSFQESIEENNAQELFCSVANVGIVKDFAKDEYRDYEASDFALLPEVSDLSFLCLNLLCQRCKSNHFPKPKPATLVTLLCLCGTHHRQFLWTKDTSVLGSLKLCRSLYQLMNKKNIRELLIQESSKGSTIVKDTFQHLKGSLNKDNWRKNPCTRYVFKWILFQLNHFELPDLLTDVLPPALLFVDDHALENKLLGIHCLHHIIKNVPPTVLSWQGRADVVYDALRHLTYTHEAEIINALHPCLLDLLAGMEPDPNLNNRKLKICRYDELFSYLLLCMALEQKIKLRHAFAMQLPLYINRMGITVLSHGKKLFNVVDEYLATFDGPSECSRLNVLLAVQLLIKTAWPRIPMCCGKLLKPILKLLFDMTINPPDIKESIKEEVILKAKECLILLNKACPDTFQGLTSEVIRLEGVADPVVEVLKSVMCKEETDKRAVAVVVEQIVN